eukprot:1590779-Pyramimonas_sp.AAC.1
MLSDRRADCFKQQRSSCPILPESPSVNSRDLRVTAISICDFNWLIVLVLPTDRCGARSASSRGGASSSRGRMPGRMT